MECRQYTIRGVPGYLDLGLRGYAREESVLSRFLSNARIEVLYADLQTTRIYGELFAQLRA